jgi:hypothetical protein
MNQLVDRVADRLRATCREEYGSDWNIDVARNFARASLNELRTPPPQVMAILARMVLDGSKATGPRWLDERWNAIVDILVRPG